MPWHKDKTGQRFGKLIAIEKIPLEGGDYRYKCLCDCGKIHEVGNSALKKNSGTRSCGCWDSQPKRWENLIAKKPCLGKTYNNLTIIGYSKMHYVICKCNSCGKEDEYKRNTLLYGGKRLCSCGDRATNAKYNTREEALWAKAFGRINNKNRANFDNYQTDLSLEEFKALALQNCTYCGRPPANKVKLRGKDSDKILYFSGLDRIDSNLPYQKDNVIPCCKECNRCKSDRNIDEFLDWIKRVYENLVINPFNPRAPVG